MARQFKGEPGRLELEVMHIVWQKDETSVREVLKEINKDRDLAYTTIMTTMKNLEQKGYLTHREEERVFIYRALVKKEEIESSMLNNLVNTVFKGSFTRLVNQLIKNDSLSTDQVKDLLASIEHEKAQKENT